MKTKIFTTLFLAVLFVSAYAYDVEVDGICYNLNLTEQTASVASPRTDGNYIHYKGDIIVPEQFSYRGRTFTVTSVDDNVFSYSDSLLSVSLPKSIKVLPWGGLFQDCINLTRVVLPDSIREIPASCFFNCKKLSDVAIPDSVTSIDDFAFCGCESLGPIYSIRPNITSLGHESLTGCSSIKRLIFEDTDTPLSAGGYSWPFFNMVIDYMYVGRPLNCGTGADTIKVMEIGKDLKENAIPTNNNFSAIISDIEDPTQMTPYFVNNVYLNVPLYVPVGTVEAYRQADGWKNFFEIKENDGSVDGISNIKTKSMEKSAASYYDISGRMVGKKHKGLTILKYNDGTSKKVIIR